MNITERDIVATMLDVPHSFEVEGEHFFIYQPSLAKVYINARAAEELEINGSMMDRNALLEIMRVAKQKRMECCRLIAYNTFCKKADVLNPIRVNSRAVHLNQRLSDEDIVTLVITCIGATPITDLIKFLKINEDEQLRNRVQNAKVNTSTYIFGGKSIYGTLISAAIEKYHWTYDYILWGISYANLQLLLADSITTVYLTEDERKNAHIPPANAKKVKVTSKEDMERIKKMFGQ